MNTHDIKPPPLPDWFNGYSEADKLVVQAYARAAVEADRQGRMPSDDLHTLQHLLSWAERQVCLHEETHRGGAIWEICDQCDAKWADDEGGKPEFQWPESIVKARALLSRYSSGQPAASTEPNTHIDDDAVDHFAVAMKEKLAQARAKGRSRWFECDPADLSAMLRAHVEKGDPRDVANFCMFLWSLGQPIAAPVAQEPVAWTTAQDWEDAHDIEAAAKTLAECMGYPWEPMPEKGREAMRKYAKRVIDAARAAKGAGDA